MGRRTAQRRDETGDGARARIGTVLLATVIAAAPALGGAAPARSTIVDGAIGAPPHSAFLRSAQRSLMPIVPNVRVIAGEAGVAACEAGRRTAGAGVPEAGIAACADYPDTIVFSTARSGPDAPRVFLHELGHLWDWQELTDRDRLAFARIRRARPGSPWVDDAHPERSLNEEFAEGYALCAVHARIRVAVHTTGYGFRVTPRQHRPTCRLVRSSSGT